MTTPEDPPYPDWFTLTPEVQDYVLFVLEERYAQLAQACARAEADRVLRSEALKRTVARMGDIGPMGSVIGASVASVMEESEPVETVLLMAVRSAIEKLTERPREDLALGPPEPEGT